MLIVNKHAPFFYQWLEFINIHMLNYQIGHLWSVCESGGEFSSVLRANYSEFTVSFTVKFHEWGPMCEYMVKN